VVFFDLDETLLDQRSAEARAMSRLLEFYREELPRNFEARQLCRIWRYLRESAMAGFLENRISLVEQRRHRIRQLFAMAGRKLSDSEADERFAFYFEHYRKSWKLFEDVLPCLDALDSFALGVISNGSSLDQRAKLIRTGIRDRFEVVVVSQDVGFPKPRREIFLTACRSIGRSPTECVHVGDRLIVDALGSRLAGLSGIFLSRDGSQRSTQVPTISSLRELSRVIGDPRFQGPVCSEWLAADQA